MNNERLIVLQHHSTLKIVPNHTVALLITKEENGFDLTISTLENGDIDNLKTSLIKALKNSSEKKKIKYWHILLSGSKSFSQIQKSN